MLHIKATLGRVCARYYNWFGMTGRRKTALKKHGWTEERIGDYDRAHRLSVSPAHEGENPIVLAPTDDDWLKRHKLSCQGGPRQDHSCRPSHSARGVQLSLQEEQRSPTDGGLVQLSSERSADTRSQWSYSLEGSPSRGW